jgi:hypothetical protein
MIDVTVWFSKEHGAMRVTGRVAAREGKKADDGTMTSSVSDANPTTVADPSASRTLRPATTTQSSNIELKMN